MSRLARLTHALSELHDLFVLDALGDGQKPYLQDEAFLAAYLAWYVAQRGPGFVEKLFG